MGWNPAGASQKFLKLIFLATAGRAFVIKVGARVGWAGVSIMLLGHVVWDMAFWCNYTINSHCCKQAHPTLTHDQSYTSYLVVILPRRTLNLNPPTPALDNFLPVPSCNYIENTEFLKVFEWSWWFITKHSCMCQAFYYFAVSYVQFI